MSPKQNEFGAASDSQIATFLGIWYHFYGRFPEKGIGYLELSSTDLIQVVNYRRTFQQPKHFESLPRQPSNIMESYNAYSAAIRWLKFYGMLELAYFCLAIPSKIPPTFLTQFKSELSLYQAGALAEAGFPVTAIFSERLANRYASTVGNGEVALKIFRRMMLLDDSVRSDAALNVIFNFAVSNAMENEDEEALFAMLDSPDRFATTIAQSENHGKAPVLLVEGLLSFFSLCTELDEILRICNELEQKELGTCIRHYYAHVLDPVEENDQGPFARAIRSLLGLCSRLEAEDANSHEWPSRSKDVANALFSISKRQWPVPSQWETLLGQYGRTPVGA